ncbi:uncharacterized protein K452DRAFT_288345 [Aplosporella prunicola CBS 121167]|uniref:Mediator of RNA polymerase II transcription subunit 8 n=1 Tax=Aplosporella prunicola CBS 121167 TaxID=1176127 RepID=A0A6A6BEQ2_9PEZI|nr:uncharacterized protein K452DRAFT_288345 [Aplosporella prunicola CBS 121167]KAF2140951.1 hypothetical protein K452DRAFT_288345 [Aplosporella prunicola CBS 121167]
MLTQRLQTLNSALEVMKKAQTMHTYDVGPPPWLTTLNQTNVITGRLNSLLETFNNSRTLLNQAHSYPLPSFPGRTHEAIATQLTRKKLEPWVEDWVADGVKHGQNAGLDPENKESVSVASGVAAIDGAPEGVLSAAQLDELWDWAGPAGGNVGRSVMSGEMDEDEGEDEDEDEEDEGEDEGAMEGVEGTDKKGEGEAPAVPMMPLGDILRFATTGGFGK